MGHAIDFEFSGVQLSIFDSMICYFDAGAEKTESLGGKTSFTTFRPISKSELIWTGTKHEEPLTTKIRICKRICGGKRDESIYTNDEVRKMMRWLNRSDGYHKLYFFDEGNRSDWYYNAQINVSEIKIGGNIVAFELEITTDKPWATVHRSFTRSISSLVDFITINDMSDEIGTTGIDMEITAHESGDLTICNSAQKKDIVIKDCATGEIISLNGINEIIASNYDRLADRFNWVYPQISNFMNAEIDLRENKFTFSLPCTVAVNWDENRKVGISLWID